VIDWEYASIGDPAYDLAIITRGNAKLCGLNNGLKRLLAAYHEAGGVRIMQADVVAHELLLVLSWLADSVRSERQGNREGHSPREHRDKLRAILRRVESP
jgi:thiamine kinase-like enzyme